MELRGRLPLARGRELWVDVLVALGFGAVQVLGTLASMLGYGRLAEWRPLDGWAYALLVTGAAALLFRRRWPLGVLAVTQATSLAYAWLHYPEGPSAVVIYPALYTVAVTMPRRQAGVAGGVAALLAAATELLFYGDTMFDGEPLYSAVATLAVLWLGESVRARRAYVAELRDRAERAERTREEEARRRVDEERLRIARELHDVVSHTIGVISVQAGVAAHLLHRRPDKAADSLAAIRQASDEALGELHAMLGVLRERDGDPGRAPLSPAPGLAELDALVAQAAGPGSRSGCRWRASRGGSRRPSTWPPTGWSRSRSPTSCATPKPAGPTSPSPTATAGLRLRSSTTGTAPTTRRATGPVGAARGSRACGNGPGPSGAAWRPAPGPGAASASRPASR
jgi:signal transduction histidine kinase